MHTGDTTGMGSMRLLEAVSGSSGALGAVLAGRYPRRDAIAATAERADAALPAVTVWRRRQPIVLGDLQLSRSVAGLVLAVNGILFNHESPRRGETFALKDHQAVARIKVRYPVRGL